MDLTQLQVSITPHLSQYYDSLNIDLTVHNLLSHPVTVLTWESPLDPRCALLGIVEIVDTATDLPLPVDKVFFNRQMPPAPESFIQIGSHEEAINSVSIPDVNLDPGKEYRIQVKGRWKAVWGDSIERVDAGSLKDMTEACAGDFVSNHIIIPKRHRADPVGDSSNG